MDEGQKWRAAAGWCANSLEHCDRQRREKKEKEKIRLSFQVMKEKGSFGYGLQLNLKDEFVILRAKTKLSTY